MNPYAESSAVPAWLLGEVAGSRVREALCRAEQVFASDLVLIECDRVLIRGVALREIDEATAANRRPHLNAAAVHWHMYRLSLDIVERVRRAFPVEPVRTLDAIHLASAVSINGIICGEAVGDCNHLADSGCQLCRVDSEMFLEFEDQAGAQ